MKCNTSYAVLIATLITLSTSVAAVPRHHHDHDGSNDFTVSSSSAVPFGPDTGSPGAGAPGVDPTLDKHVETSVLYSFTGLQYR